MQQCVDIISSNNYRMETCFIPTKTPIKISISAYNRAQPLLRCLDWPYFLLFLCFFYCKQPMFHSGPVQPVQMAIIGLDVSDNEHSIK